MIIMIIKYALKSTLKEHLASATELYFNEFNSIIDQVAAMCLKTVRELFSSDAYSLGGK